MKSLRLSIFATVMAALFASGLTAFAVNISGTNSGSKLEQVWVGIPVVTREEAITAVASGTITTAYQLTAGLSQVTTIATGGDAVKLPPTTSPQLSAPQGNGSMMMIIINAHASNSLNIFPNLSTDTINAVAAGGAYALAAGKVAECFVGATGKWYCQLSA